MGKKFNVMVHKTLNIFITVSLPILLEGCMSSINHHKKILDYDLGSIHTLRKIKDKKYDSLFVETELLKKMNDPSLLTIELFAKQTELKNLDERSKALQTSQTKITEQLKKLLEENKKLEKDSNDQKIIMDGFNKKPTRNQSASNNPDVKSKKNKQPQVNKNEQLNVLQEENRELEKKVNDHKMKIDSFQEKLISNHTSQRVNNDSLKKIDAEISLLQVKINEARSKITRLKDSTLLTLEKENAEKKIYTLNNDLCWIDQRLNFLMRRTENNKEFLLKKYEKMRPKRFIKNIEKY